MRSNFTAGQVNNTWQDTIEVAFAAVNCLVLLVTLHVGILANLFVAWAVRHQKSLQTSNNALLVNLAVIDLLRCVIDCPLLLSIVLSARDLGLLFCSAQIASFSLICCVQLLTLACISAERYQAIAHPFSTERKKRITVWILLTWLAPISISVICVIFAKDSPVYIRCRGLRKETLDSYDTFGLYILTPVWCVCLTVIVGFYGRIFLLVKAHGRKIFDKGSLPPPEKKEDKKQKHMETKNSIKSDTENPQTINTNYIKLIKKEPSGENNPLDLNATAVTNLNKHDPEILTEKSINELSNETPEVLKGIVETNDHQNTTSSLDTSPSANEEVGAVESSTNQVTDGEVSLGSTNGEGGEEDPTSETSPSAYEDAAVKSSTNQVTNGEVSGGTTNGEGGEEDPTSKTSPSANEDAGTVESSTPQDTETSPASGNGEDAEEQSAPQETAAEASPALTGETTAAPQQQEEEEEVAGAVCMMPSLAQRERGNAKKESKLAKRSGYIIFTFLIFWIPLIATVVLNHFFYQDGNRRVS
ncbi:dopamine D2-like receptor [Pseudorasbora parva]|uniref:dopamine D2-like receptor n=1 Tax=Pseudorasbora parva TaxID=51549 RepID=UPI00351DF038